MPDLNSKFRDYLNTLYDTNTGTSANTRTDMTTYVAKDLPTIIAAAPTQVDDRNTLYNVALP